MSWKDLNKQMHKHVCKKEDQRSSFSSDGFTKQNMGLSKQAVIAENEWFASLKIKSILINLEFD